MGKEKRVAQLINYIEQNSFTNVAAYLDLADTAAIKQWIFRDKIPDVHWRKLTRLLKGERHVKIQVIKRQKTKA